MLPEGVAVLVFLVLPLARLEPVLSVLAGYPPAALVPVKSTGPLGVPRGRLEGLGAKRRRWVMVGWVPRWCGGWWGRGLSGRAVQP